MPSTTVRSNNNKSLTGLAAEITFYTRRTDLKKFFRYSGQSLHLFCVFYLFLRKILPIADIEFSLDLEEHLRGDGEIPLQL